MGPVQCKFCCFFCLTVFGYSYLSIFQSLLTLLISFKHFIYCAIQQVFMLFSYQAFYVLCPVVPFGRYFNALIYFLSSFTAEISPICPRLYLMKIALLHCCLAHL